MTIPVSEQEAGRRAVAVEGALLLLINRLAERGIICTNEAADMLSLLSRSSDVAAARCSNSMNNLDRLRQLRGGDGGRAPGAELMSMPAE